MIAKNAGEPPRSGGEPPRSAGEPPRQLSFPFPSDSEPTPPRRKSKLSPEEVDALLEQSAAGVRYLRRQLDQVFRLPRHSIRLR